MLPETEVKDVNSKDQIENELVELGQQSGTTISTTSNENSV